ncbi:MAG: 4Fe-4S dicluster domain-containing protein [Deltaproteobacteria bacterium]|jgi:ferredoxin|nr:4Fe-4S dicluster domain-containing protein [Deltaproteobacteria bacterium]
MPEYIAKKSALTDFFKALSAGRRLLTPQGAGDQCRLAETAPDQVKLDYVNTHMSPKTLFFPQTEKLMAFHKDASKPDANIYSCAGDKAVPTVVFGLRPCDARGLSVANKVFQNDRFTDPYWKGKFDQTVSVGLACAAPAPQCFCAAMGGSPYGLTGLDILAFRLEGGDLGLKAGSEAGEALLKDLKLESADLAAVFNSQQAAAIQAQGVAPDYRPIDEANLMALFQDPHWLSTAENCLNCGVCTFFCPTCHCFDIQDEQDEKGGVRMRNWDTCMSWLFTVHGTGHNPRPSKTERVRQRFMHKLKYIPLKQDGVRGCTGCGRCVAMCPVNIDIRAVALKMCQSSAPSQA